MKKLLSSKKNGPTCRCLDVEINKIDRSVKSHKQPRKHTVLPNWVVRNDSTNVSAVLHPDDYILSPRSVATNKGKKKQEDKHKGVYKKCCRATNTCYCKEGGIRPTILSRPNTCPALEDGGKIFPEDDFRRTCLCKDDTVSCTHSDLLKKHRDESEKTCTCLSFSKQRSDYESLKEQEEEKASKTLATIMSTQIAGSRTMSTDIDDLANFRKNHYFETHSTDDLEKKEASEHTHLHQYKLDDRLLPEPTNVDPYGRSRCSVCSSTIESGIGGTQASRSVCFCEDDSRVELQLTGKDLERFGGFVGRFRRPEYFNTLALRQQKMVRYRKRMDGGNGVTGTCIYY